MCACFPLLQGWPPVLITPEKCHENPDDASNDDDNEMFIHSKVKMMTKETANLNLADSLVDRTSK
jgi:hypothetical protein